jgi:hypothetical protein
MKYLGLIVMSAIILVACGKYEKPFISFRSPEKRITGKIWETTKINNSNGVTLTETETIKLEINGEDSTFIRIYNESDTVIGNWKWLAALRGEWDKQRLVLLPQNGKRNVFDIRVLTNKKMELIDRDGDTTAGNEYFFEAK